MPAREAIVCVRLDDDRAAAVDAKVASGRWSDRSAYLRDLIDADRKPAEA